MSHKKIMTLYIIKDDSIKVFGKTSYVNLVSFHGYCESEIFSGKILPLAVDTQRVINGNEGSSLLSARYVLEGTDQSGQKCRLFIENNGIADESGIRTVPKIITDSTLLAWLETADLEGVICEDENGIKIEFFDNSTEH